MVDIFYGNKEENLAKYKSTPALFTRMENSTCTVKGRLAPISFSEEEMMADFTSCEGNIVRIDSNFGHLVAENYVEKSKVKKSNRGRKPKPKERKNRIYQGDGTSFNSQITFTIIGRYRRHVPLCPDRYTKDAEKLPNGQEIVTKEYKIKLFRTGSYTVPGVLAESLVDVRKPLEDLCTFLNELYLTDIAIADLQPVMRNYKFVLLDGRIDMLRLQEFCASRFTNLLNVRFADLEDFLINPVFTDTVASPRDEGWLEAIIAMTSETQISFRAMFDHLREPTKSRDKSQVKNLFVNPGTLPNKIQQLGLNQKYQTVASFVRAAAEEDIEFSDQAIKKLVAQALHPLISSLQASLFKSPDNMMCRIKYDPEKYPGFLIKIKTPLPTQSDKLTTIKIFPSGKINVDGANNRQEAEFIYHWLNYLFYQNPQFVYRTDDDHEGSDSEFSSGEEDD